MQFTTVFATVAAFAAAAQAAVAMGNSTQPAVVTEVVTAYTTFCPAATTLTAGGNTYTVTSATTLTIPCATGCTVVKSMTSSVVTACSTCTGKATTTPVAPVSAIISGAPTKAANGTGAYVPPTKTGTVSQFTGAANVVAGSGSLAAILGFAIWAL